MTKKQNIKKYTFLIGVLFLFPLSLILFFGVFSEHKFKTLPYLGPKEVLSTKNSDGVSDTAYYQIPDFEFTNQNGNNFTRDSLRGRVWLASFYATNSPHIRKITDRLLAPNWRYRHETDIGLLCMTLDASYDTPAVMKAYVNQTTTQNITPDKWQFLTGDQDAINSYITKAFFIEDPQYTAQLFLIDTIGNIRGQYNGNLEEEIKAAIEDIALLKKEMDIRSYEEKKRAEQNNSNSN